MADIQLDIDSLKRFAQAISDLRGALSQGFVPAVLMSDPHSAFPNVGQKVPMFKDAENLYTHYESARSKIIGDGHASPGSFADLLTQLQVLENVATQIYQNYQSAGNEDTYSAQQVDQALNTQPSPASGAGN